jgi:hypothetical protein
MLSKSEESFFDLQEKELNDEGKGRNSCSALLFSDIQHIIGLG